MRRFPSDDIALTRAKRKRRDERLTQVSLAIGVHVCLKLRANCSSREKRMKSHFEAWSEDPFRSRFSSFLNLVLMTPMKASRTPGSTVSGVPGIFLNGCDTCMSTRRSSPTLCTQSLLDDSKAD